MDEKARVDDAGSVVGMLPPPREADVLFGYGEDCQLNACVNSHMFSMFDDAAYRDGFRRAALQLAEQVCETASGQDVLIYPIVYLYRHHTELALKSLIETASGLLDSELTRKQRETLGGHKLANLWELARPMLNPVCELAGNAEFPADDLAGIASYIRQLHEHDPDGQRFRYASLKARGASPRREASLPPDLKIINIRAFAAAMEKLADYLDNVESWFSHLADLRADMQAEYARACS